MCSCLPCRKINNFSCIVARNVADISKHIEFICQCTSVWNARSPTTLPYSSHARGNIGSADLFREADWLIDYQHSARDEAQLEIKCLPLVTIHIRVFATTFRIWDASWQSVSSFMDSDVPTYMLLTKVFHANTPNMRFWTSNMCALHYGKFHWNYADVGMLSQVITQQCGEAYVFVNFASTLLQQWRITG